MYSERVIYIGTLNKALFPGLRLGYAVVPHALLSVFLRARYLMDRQPPSLQQAVVTEFMQQGYFTAHIRRMRHAYCEQRDALVATLKRRAGDHLKIDVPDQGMHLVAYLAKGFSDNAIESKGTTSRHRGARHQPLLSIEVTSLRADAGLQRISAGPDRSAAARLGGLITQRAASSN